MCDEKNIELKFKNIDNYHIQQGDTEIIWIEAETKS
jgi:hypothetical protein